ncbi:MAG: glycosyltransferase family 2 protein [Candidatus Lokiarchaeota archaeon]|nr:glycosyltransferase family 2 protein [Candidatus Lokiarchaeota archaeon]
MIESQKPFVSIIIAVRNEELTIKECIEAVLNQDYPHESYEILVIDGMSEDKTREIIDDIVKSNPNRIKLFDNPYKIASCGRNKGIKKAKGEFVGILHGRGIINKCWISELVRILVEKGEKVGCAGCIALTANKTLVSEAEEYALNSIFGGFRTATSKILSKEKKTEIFKAESIGVALYRKSVFTEVGLYDENLFSGEDFELNYRIRKHNYEILGSTNAYINYYRRKTLKSIFSRLFNFGQGRALIIKKHRDSFKFFYLIPLLFAIFTIFFGLFNLITFSINVIFNVYLFGFIRLFNLALDTLFQLFYLSIISIYFIIVILFSIMSYKKFTNKSASLVLFAIFPIMHIGYGLGFLRGLFPYRKTKITR